MRQQSSIHRTVEFPDSVFLLHSHLKRLFTRLQRDLCLEPILLDDLYIIKVEIARLAEIRRHLGIDIQLPADLLELRRNRALVR